MTEIKQQSGKEGESYSLPQSNGVGKRGCRKKRRFSSRGDLIFMAVMLLYPTLQFLAFYVATNVNSFALVMQKISKDGSFVWVSDFRNFTSVFKDIADSTTGVSRAIGNSFIVYVIHLIVNIPIAILFSYYIFKKFVGHRFYKIMLFLPQILSVYTMCFIYFYFTNDGMTSFLQEIGLLKDKLPLFSEQESNEYLYLCILFAYVFFSFGSSMLLYLGAISGINESILEAAKIDGANNTQELVRIVLPQIYPTIKTFLIVGIALIFTDQFNLVSLFGAHAPERYRTIGYYFYQILITEGQPSYPYLAAFGMIISAVLIPITLPLNKWLDKLDPSVG